VPIVVHVIRHAQTIVNVTGERVYDPGLTELGRLQAGRLAAALRDDGLTLVASSPLLRALETAAPVARTAGAPLVVWNDLVELNAWDPYRGASRAELAARFPEAELEPDMPAAGWSYPGPEPLACALERAARVVARISALPDGSRVALVAHGTFNGLLLARWLRAGPGSAALVQDNACLNTLRLEPGRVTLLRLNDTAHLGA
jgi:probable phosphoglycerate mutase